MKWNLQNTYAGLPAKLYSLQGPTPVKDPALVIFNEPLATSLGLGEFAPEDLLVLSGNKLPEGSTPIAQAYSGHQFGHFNHLGDGRAVLLGEQITAGGERFDLQLKGSGQTPYSRRGDGRAAIGPMLREYLVSEAMFALGIPTTRSLAVVSTGEVIFRERPLPGAILTRVAASHIRVGTFQFAASLRDLPVLKALADHTIARHYAELAGQPNPYLSFIRAVCQRQAKLVADWLAVGFIHGVMNTDNMAISGETIDYGPCAFLDAFDPQKKFSSIDQNGRYAYGRQPVLAEWNLTRLAEALLPLLAAEPAEAKVVATEAVESFRPAFEKAWSEKMFRKLGILDPAREDSPLLEGFLGLLHKNKADFTNSFRQLSRVDGPTNVLGRDPAFALWWAEWKVRVARGGRSWEEICRDLNQANPMVILRNHWVEAALAAFEDNGSLDLIHDLLQVLERPFAEGRVPASLLAIAPLSEGTYQTFCGT